MRKTIPVSDKAGAWIFVIVAAVMLVLGASLVFTPQIKSGTCTVEVSAVVTDNIHNQTTGTRKTHYFIPVFDFDYEGKHYRVSPNGGANKIEFRTGSTVKLHIDPNDPENFYAPRTSTDYTIGIVFMVLSIIALIIMLPVALKKKDAQGS